MQSFIVAVGLSFIVNGMLFLITENFICNKVNFFRIFIALVINCLLNCIFTFSKFDHFAGRWGVLLSGAIGASICFFGRDYAIRGICIYLILQIMILLISVNAIDYWSIRVALMCLCVYMVKKLSVDPSCTSEIIDVEIVHNEKKVQLKALKDTGNLLIDPLTGKSVLLIGADITKDLIGLNKQQISDPVSTISENTLPGLRLLPFTTVGKSNGMLLAYKFKHVKIGGKQGSRLVAFSPDGLTGEFGYDALAGGENWL